MPALAERERASLLDANKMPAPWRPPTKNTQRTVSPSLPAIVIVMVVVVVAKNQRSVFLAAASLIGPSWWLIAMQRKPQIPGSLCRQPYLPAVSQSVDGGGGSCWCWCSCFCLICRAFNLRRRPILFVVAKRRAKREVYSAFVFL